MVANIVSFSFSQALAISFCVFVVLQSGHPVADASPVPSKLRSNDSIHLEARQARQTPPPSPGTSPLSFESVASQAINIALPKFFDELFKRSVPAFFDSIVKLMTVFSRDPNNLASSFMNIDLAAAGLTEQPTTVATTTTTAAAQVHSSTTSAAPSTAVTTAGHADVASAAQQGPVNMDAVANQMIIDAFGDAIGNFFKG